jgi:hypothetical protein
MECGRAAGVVPEIIGYPDELLDPQARHRFPRACFPFGDEPAFVLDTRRARTVLDWPGASLAASTDRLHADHQHRQEQGRLAAPEFQVDDAVRVATHRRSTAGRNS